MKAVSNINARLMDATPFATYSISILHSLITESKSSAVTNSMSEAIFLYLTQVSLQKGIPFELKMPNDLTRDTIIKYLIISSPALAGFFVCGIMGRL